MLITHVQNELMGYQRTTRTFVTLEVSEMVFKEIAEKLKAAGYGHTFLKENKHGPTLIDMNSIALTPEVPDPSLKDQYPMVLYMRSKKDADEFVAALKEAKPHMITRHL